MKVKNEKGSITIFVLIGLLFMTSFLMISYAYNVNKSKIAKEQFDSISDIYSYKDGDENAYDRAYTALRKKKKQIITKTVEYSSKIEIEKSYADKISNYKIYGSFGGLGNLVSGETNKYVIPIKIIDINDDNIADDTMIYKEQVCDIIINNPLNENDYIDYRLRKIIRNDGTEESIELPEMSTYEDYTKIEVLTGSIPSKIEVEYTGYKFE